MLVNIYLNYPHLMDLDYISLHFKETGILLSISDDHEAKQEFKIRKYVKNIQMFAG